MEWHYGEYTITTSKSRIDINAVHLFLTNSSYWAAGIPIETVERSINGSLCFSMLHGDKQVGFARVITDEATFAYLADVFVLDEYRGKGLSKWLMQTIISYPALQHLRRFMLATKDAHSLYAQFGFKPLNNVERWMIIHKSDVYKKS